MSVTSTVLGSPFLPPSSRADKEGDMERDAGFCSGGEDEDLDDLHSPTDVSEDSVEVKVQPICLRNKNKRKCAEPRKVASDEVTARTPYKKRRHFQVQEPAKEAVSPFRPWSQSTPPPQYTERVPELPQHQEEPLSLVLRQPEFELSGVRDEFKRLLFKPEPERRPFAAVARHMDVSTPGPSRASEASCSYSRGGHSETASDVEDLSGRGRATSSGSQRNYKNMTRERRIEANARERTRVHTISAAFDTLRRTVPSYSHNQKLSKLSVLRIACSYILTLSRVAGSDYSADGSSPSLADCVDMVSRTIQTEGKLRKKKDE